jgi:glycosyltransferase involved in cell wall biosynthesis
VNTAPLHIAFVSPYGHHGSHSGARNRVESLVRALSDIAPRLRITCLSPWHPGTGATHIPFSLEGNAARRVAGLAQLSWRLQGIRPDLVISESPLAPLAFGRFKVLHMVHDAKFATAQGRRGARLTHVLHKISARMAQGVLTVSHAERSRLVDALGIDADRIAVSYNGLSDAWLDRPLPPPEQPRQFDLLYVSNFAAHKGHLELLACARGKPWRIAFVGADFGERQRCIDYARQHGIALTCLSGLSEEALIDVYDDSRAFVFPSHLEGFGIPFIEARSRGLPVLCSDIPVFRELCNVVGGDITDFADTAHAIEGIEAVLSRGVQASRLDRFNWRQIAEGVLAEAMPSETRSSGPSTARAPHPQLSPASKQAR